MKKELRWYDYVSININWFALTTRGQALTPLIVPLLVQQFIGEANKGTYLGNMRLWALMVALLTQALIGLLSDRTTSRFGRRKPFIFIGAFLEVIVFILIGFSADFEGITGYWILFGLYILSMVSANISHAATQGFIPDLVPDEKKGLASGIKALLELPVPLIFVSFVIAGMVEKNNLWGVLLILMAIMLISMAITMFAPEEPLREKPPKIDWTPFIRLILMTGIFTLVILGSGWAVKQVFLIADRLPHNQALLLGGVAGLLGMGVSILIGVHFSLRISLKGEILDHQSFKWWVINRLTFLVAANNLAGFMVFFLQEKFPEYPGAAAAGPATKILMFVGIFILIFALPSGWLADKIGKKSLTSLAAILTGIGAGIIIFAPEITGLIYIGASVAGAGVGMFYSSNWALGTELVPKDQAGQFLGLSNLAGAGAGAIGAYIGGPIGDNQGYVLLMSIFGLLALLSMFALLGIKSNILHMSPKKGYNLP